MGQRRWLHRHVFVFKLNMASKNNRAAVEHIDFSKVIPEKSLLVVCCEESSVQDFAAILALPEFCPKNAVNTPIVFLRPGESLKVLDEKEMNALGWYKL